MIHMEAYLTKVINQRDDVHKTSPLGEGKVKNFDMINVTFFHMTCRALFNYGKSPKRRRTAQLKAVFFFP